MAAQRFKAMVYGGDLEAARAALDGVRIPTLGPTYMRREGDEWRMVANPIGSVLAIVDADDVDDARARVGAVLPEGCTVESVELLREEVS